MKIRGTGDNGDGSLLVITNMPLQWQMLRVKDGHGEEVPILLDQFCYEPQTILKTKVH